MSTRNQYIRPLTTMMDITVTHVLMASGGNSSQPPSGNVDPNPGDFITGG